MPKFLHVTTFLTAFTAGALPCQPVFAQQTEPMVVQVPTPGAVQEAQHRFTFRDLEVGSRVPKDPKKSGFNNCRKWGGTTTCTYLGEQQIAGLPLLGVANYDDAGLYELQVEVGQQVSGILRSALEARYGTPCATDTSEVQNSYGAKFVRDTVSWCFTDGMATFQSVASNPKEASFSFLSKVELDKRAPSKPKVDF